MKTVHFTTLATTAALMLSTPVFAQGTTAPAADPAAPAVTTPAPAAPATPDASAPAATAPAASAPVAAPEGFSPVPDYAMLTADQLKGIALHGPDNSDIGKVTDIELGADGRATGLIADIGGFLGLGSHTVRLSFEEVGVFSNADGRMIAISSLSEEALKALPAYEKPAQ